MDLHFRFADKQRRYVSVRRNFFPLREPSIEKYFREHGRTPRRVRVSGTAIQVFIGQPRSPFSSESSCHEPV